MGKTKKRVSADEWIRKFGQKGPASDAAHMPNDETRQAMVLRLYQAGYSPDAETAKQTLVGHLRTCTIRNTAEHSAQTPTVHGFKCPTVLNFCRKKLAGQALSAR